MSVSLKRPLPSFGLSRVQHRFMFVDRLNPASPMHSLVATIELRGPLDSRALQSALEWIAGEHEVLRTTIQATQSEMVQIPHGSIELNLAIDDLAGRADDARQSSLARAVSEEEGRPFSFGAPLWRAR